MRSKEPRVVWIGWATATLVAIAHAYACGERYAYADDWDLVVPILTGARPLSLTWLWAQHNEHRIPLPRLAMVLSERLMHGDFRAPVYFGIIAMSLAAAALVVLLQKWRGRSALVDLCVPLALLRIGNSAFAWGGELQFVTTTAIAIGVLSAESGPLLLLLPLCGGSGLVIAGPLALWLAWDAKRRQRWAHLVCAIGTIALCLVYFIGWQKTPQHTWAAPTPSTILVTAAHYLGGAANPSFAALWPLDALITIAWIVLALVWLRRAFREQRTPRSDALTMFLFVQLLLALAIGFGRAGRGWLPDLEYHYASLSLGLTIALIVTSIVCAPDSRWIQIGLLALIGIPYVATARFALRNPRAAETRALTDDLAAGVAPSKIAAEHVHLLHSDEDTPALRARLALDIEAMQRAGLMPRKE